MTFHIFSIKGETFLTDEAGEGLPVASEAAAIDLAVRTAQEAEATYRLNYWSPVA